MSDHANNIQYSLNCQNNRIIVKQLKGILKTKRKVDSYEKIAKDHY